MPKPPEHRLRILSSYCESIDEAFLCEQCRLCGEHCQCGNSCDCAICIERRETEGGCIGHVASAADPKVCERCGIHIDELRPPEEGEYDVGSS